MSEIGARNWIDVGDWGKGMDGFKLAPSAELAGKQLKLHLSSSVTINYLFHSATSLSWENLEGPDRGQHETETYEALQVAPNVFFVDFVRTHKPRVSTSIALDLNTRRATVLSAALPTKKKASQGFASRLGRGIDLSMVEVHVLHATANPTSSDETVLPHERTAELVGKRIRYTYSSAHVYEHLYLNDRLFTWHCLKGLEKGLADTEVCDCFKIAPDLYLFTWREKVMPTFGVVIIDLKRMRSNGKTFGLDLTSGKYVNFAMGSRSELVSETSLVQKPGPL